MKNPRTPAQIEALALARLRRQIAAERTIPGGYRSLDHLMRCAEDQAKRVRGGHANLARYLRVDERTVRRWLKLEKKPLNPTLEAIAAWMETFRHPRI